MDDLLQQITTIYESVREERIMARAAVSGHRKLGRYDRATERNLAKVLRKEKEVSAALQKLKDGVWEARRVLHRVAAEKVEVPR